MYIRGSTSRRGLLTFIGCGSHLIRGHLLHSLQLQGPDDSARGFPVGQQQKGLIPGIPVGKDAIRLHQFLLSASHNESTEAVQASRAENQNLTIGPGSDQELSSLGGCYLAEVQIPASVLPVNHELAIQHAEEYAGIGGGGGACQKAVPVVESHSLDIWSLNCESLASL